MMNVQALGLCFLFALIVSTGAQAAYEAPPTVNPKAVTLRAGSERFSGDVTGAALNARFNLITGVVKLVGGANVGDYLLVTAEPSASLRRLTSDFSTVNSFTLTGAAAGRTFTAVATSSATANRLYLSSFSEVFDVNGGTLSSTFLAGRNTSGTSDGVGGTAAFSQPKALAVSSDDNQLIVVDTSNGCIRSVVLGGSGTRGTVTTVGGRCGYPGFKDDTTGTSAEFFMPDSIVAVGISLFYVSDPQGRIRRLNSASSWATHTVGATLPGYGGPLTYDALATPPTLYMLRSGGVWAVGNLTDDSSTYLEWYPTNRESSFDTGRGLSSIASALPRVETGGIITAVTSTGVLSISMSDTTGTYAPRETQVSPTEAQYSTTVVAGTGYDGNVNGFGNVAQFRSPKGIAQMPNGGFVVCDSGNSALKLVTGPSGAAWTSVTSSSVQVTTLTVTTGPELSHPSALWVENATSLYVIDGSRILLFNPTTSTTESIAGNLMSGNLDYPTNGTLALLSYPKSFALFRGDLIISDNGNYCLRKVGTATPYGVQAVAGTCGAIGDSDGVGAAARFQNPVGLAVDTRATSWLYVADGGIIRKVSSAFAVTTLVNLGSNSYLTELSWTLEDPEMLLCFSGTWLSRVNLTEESGYPREYMRTLVDGAFTQEPSAFGGMVATGTASEVFMVRAERLLRVDTAVQLTPIPDASTLPPTPQPTTTPVNFSSSSEMLAYTNLAGNDFPGTGDGTGSSARFSVLNTFAFDPSGSSRTYMYDGGRSAMRVMTNPGGVVTTLEATGEFALEVGYVRVLIFNVDGSKSHVIGGSSNVYQFDPAFVGLFSFVAGNSSAGYANGVGNQSKFNTPKGLVYESNNPSANLLVADTDNACIRGVTVDSNILGGTVDSKAGKCEEQGTADGTALNARFYAPTAIVLADSQNCFYVADHSVIRKMLATATFDVSTVATFASDQHSMDYGGDRFLSWNAGTESLFMTSPQWSSGLTELKNLTATTGAPYFQFHSIAMASNLAAYSSALRGLLVRSATDIEVIFATKVGSVRLDSLVAVRPTNPGSDTPSPLFVATQTTAVPGGGPAAQEGHSSPDDNNSNTDSFLQNHTTVVAIIGSIVGFLLLTVAAVAIVSKLKHQRQFTTCPQHSLVDTQAAGILSSLEEPLSLRQNTDREDRSTIGTRRSGREGDEDSLDRCEEFTVVSVGNPLLSAPRLQQ